MKIAHFSPKIAHFWEKISYFYLKIDQILAKIAQNWDKIFNHFSRKSSKKPHFLTFSLVFSGFYRENLVVKGGTLRGIFSDFLAPQGVDKIRKINFSRVRARYRWVTCAWAVQPCYRSHDCDAQLLTLGLHSIQPSAGLEASWCNALHCLEGLCIAVQSLEPNTPTPWGGVAWGAQPIAWCSAHDPQGSQGLWSQSIVWVTSHYLSFTTQCKLSYRI